MTESQATGLVGYACDAGVARLTLGKAPAHPLSLGMIGALREALRRAEAQTDVAMVVIEAPGRIFCAGHDLKEIARHRSDPDQGKAYLTELFTECSALMQQLAGLEKPSVAVAEGIVTAGGTQLLASCDLAFATPEATFALPGIRNGGFCTTPAVAVGRLIGRRRTMEMALTGTPFDARWAVEAGLINAAAERPEIDRRLDALAEAARAGNANAIAKGKACFQHQMELPLKQAYAEATEVMIGHFMDPGRITRDQEKWGGA